MLSLMCISILTIVALVYNIRQYYVIIAYLLMKTLESLKNENHVFNRFLLQKQLYSNPKLEVKVLKTKEEPHVYHFYKGVNNVIEFKGHKFDEIDILNVKYRKFDVK